MTESDKRNNYIITFANQKGGVGKSTLCALMAHYLVSLGVKVRVIDADRQASISQLRTYNHRCVSDLDEAEADEAIYDGRIKTDKRYASVLAEGIPWEVEQLSLESADAVEKKIEIIKAFEGVVLVDTPGSLNQNGMIPLMLMSDFVFVPFIYDMPTILATAKFLVFIDKLRKRFPDTMQSRLLLIPNKYKASVGTRKEKELIQQTIWTLKEFGSVAPDLKDTGRIQHVTTLEFNPIQRDACKPTFDFLLRESGIAQCLGLKLGERSTE